MQRNDCYLTLRGSALGHWTNVAPQHGDGIVTVDYCDVTSLCV